MPEVSCQQIVIDEADVKEVDEQRTAVRLPRADVTRLRLRHGLVAERPLVQTILGAAMLAGGGYVCYRLYAGIGETLGAGTTMLAAGVAFLCSPFVLHGAARRGYVLVVETKRSVRKLGFGKKATTAEVARFVDEARAAGVEIRVETSLSGR
jgi:hypothetical protein